MNFSKQGVFALVAQSLWEFGQLNHGQLNNSSFNEFLKFGVHADFVSMVYMDSLELVLKEFIEVNQKKWDEHLILLVIVIILSKAVQISMNKSKWITHLRKCRVFFTSTTNKAIVLT